jgi:hypothetical protein
MDTYTENSASSGLSEKRAQVLACIYPEIYRL